MRRVDGPNSTDLTIASARVDRDRLADRTDVLDRVVTRSALTELYGDRFIMNLPSTTSTFALMPRRAVLRVGMLLLDQGALA